MTRKNLREIVCALYAVAGDIAGAKFEWAEHMKRLFGVVVLSDKTLDDADRHQLARACELAQSVAHAIRDDNAEMLFRDYRKAILLDMADDARSLLGYMLRDTLSKRREVRKQAKRDNLRIARVDGDK